MRCRLWLGLAWLLLARAPGAARTSGGLRRPRSYPHLEGDVRWRRLFSSTHFFLRVDPSGLVQGTRWCHSPDTCSGSPVPLEKARLFPTCILQCVRGTSSGQAHTGIIEIRSIRVGVVALKAVHTGFFVAMSRRGHLYGSRIYTAHCRFQERIEENGYNTYASLRWRHRGRPMFLALDRRGSLDEVAGHGGTTFPLISCPSWSPEAPRGHEEQLDKIQKTSGQVARDQRLEEAQAVAKRCLVTHSFHKH